MVSILIVIATVVIWMVHMHMLVVGDYHDPPPLGMFMYPALGCAVFYAGCPLSARFMSLWCAHVHAPESAFEGGHVHIRLPVEVV